MNVVHVTHEAVEKIGGIGAVLAGLVTADAYEKTVSRTILVGPLLNTDQPVGKRLGEDGKVIYSSLDGIMPAPWAQKFSPIEKTYDVGIIYGTRMIDEPCLDKQVEVEVLIVDVFHANEARLNLFKGELFEKFNIPSHEFQKIWEYEQYIRLAEPAYEALVAIGCDGDDEQVAFLAHEYMGMPTALKVILSGKPNMRTVFYAHEVASVRPVVEDSPGHDTMFYRVLDAADKAGKYIDDIFPAVADNYKHPLVKAARYCDHIFAVGDLVVDELRFLDRHFQTADIDLVYNGIPTTNLSKEERVESKERMQKYAENILGWKPDWIFSHVARPVRSKGIWRDLRVLHELEPLLAKTGERAVYFMLGTLGGQRRLTDIRQMERLYSWPGQHEIGYPDLCGGEEDIAEMFDIFNRGHEAIRLVLVNQWDWGRNFCGDRMDEAMTFRDIRAGIDAEFGLSIYEPFGISQFEALSFGAICIVSSVCGCMALARRILANNDQHNNIIEGDFVGDYKHVTRKQVSCGQDEITEMLDLQIAQRDLVESAEGKRLAKILFDALARDETTIQKRIETGVSLASMMSWEKVVSEYFLPGLNRAIAH